MASDATEHPRVLDLADPAAESAALKALDGGRLVVIPTETVYGLGADATSGSAVLRIYEAKDRPRFNPLIVHCASQRMAQRYGMFDGRACRLAEAFWPGPLTLVVPKVEPSPISDLVTAGQRTIALRIPGLEPVRRLIAELDRPLAAPSANRSGRISPTTAEAAAADLDGRVALVLDAGPCTVGVESTIVACTGDAPVLLRPGGVAREAIEAVLGEPLGRPAADTGEDAPQAPGMLRSHYAPSARVRLEAAEARPGEAYLAFGEVPAGAPADRVLNLSASGDLREAAINLFAYLRRLDETGAETIAVAPIPEEGLGEAINDRLRRAAAPR